jgi:hypothetical protein
MFSVCVWAVSMLCVFLLSCGLPLCGECVMPVQMVVWDQSDGHCRPKHVVTMHNVWCVCTKLCLWNNNKLYNL